MFLKLGFGELLRKPLPAFGTLRLLVHFLKWQPCHFPVMVFWLLWAIYLGFSQCLLWFLLVFLFPISINNLFLLGMAQLWVSTNLESILFCVKCCFICERRRKTQWNFKGNFQVIFFKYMFTEKSLKKSKSLQSIRKNLNIFKINCTLRSSIYEWPVNNTYNIWIVRTINFFGIAKRGSIIVGSLVTKVRVVFKVKMVQTFDWLLTNLIVYCCIFWPVFGCCMHW